VITVSLLTKLHRKPCKQILL